MKEDTIQETVEVFRCPPISIREIEKRAKENPSGLVEIESIYFPVYEEEVEGQRVRFCELDGGDE